jgi:ribonucleoside-diphosphate reductase alpha chain
MDCFGTAVSMSLQYGVPLEVYVNKFSHTRFEPMGFTKNPDIKIAKSLVDYIFRWLGVTFLPGFREANKMIPPSPVDGSGPDAGDAATERRPAATMAGGPNGAHGSAKSTGSPNGATSAVGNGHGAPKQASKRNGTAAGAAVMDRVSVALLTEPASSQLSRSELFASFQSDSPTCDNCGAITVRSGNCYLCHNCGSSMGCS